MKFIAAATTGLLAPVNPDAGADSYPTRPIRLIVPWAQGRRTGSRRGGCFWGGDGAQPPGSWHGFLKWLAIATFASAPAFSTAAGTETYPTRPIRLIVPWAPGGGSEITARILGQKLGEYLGTTIVVDTRPGAASMLGTQLAARAQPDGYTLLLTDLPVTINPAVNKNVGYDLAKDFVPVSMVATSPAILVAHPSVPAASLMEYIALARAQPGKITLGHGGVGATTHVVGELFQLRAGIKLNPVPYKGTGPAVADAVAGQIQSAISTMPAAVPHIQSGRLRGLAVASHKRAAAIADVPTFADAGVKGVEGENWNGVLAPAGVPQAIIVRLNREIVKAVNQPQVRERFAALSLEAIPSTPGEFRKVIDLDLKKWAEVVKAANIHPE